MVEKKSIADLPAAAGNTTDTNEKANGNKRPFRTSFSSTDVLFIDKFYERCFGLLIATL